MTTRGGVCAHCLYEHGETNESMWMWRRGREKQDMITKLNNHSVSLLSSSREWHPTFCCFGLNCSSWRRMKRTVDWISARAGERENERNSNKYNEKTAEEKEKRLPKTGRRNYDPTLVCVSRTSSASILLTHRETIVSICLSSQFHFSALDRRWSSKNTLTLWFPSERIRRRIPSLSPNRANSRKMLHRPTVITTSADTKMWTIWSRTINIVEHKCCSVDMLN